MSSNNLEEAAGCDLQSTLQTVLCRWGFLQQKEVSQMSPISSLLLSDIVNAFCTEIVNKIFVVSSDVSPRSTVDFLGDLQAFSYRFQKWGQEEGVAYNTFLFSEYSKLLCEKKLGINTGSAVKFPFDKKTFWAIYSSLYATRPVFSSKVNCILKECISRYFCPSNEKKIYMRAYKANSKPALQFPVMQNEAMGPNSPLLIDNNANIYKNANLSPSENILSLPLPKEDALETIAGWKYLPIPDGPGRPST